MKTVWMPGRIVAGAGMAEAATLGLSGGLRRLEHSSDCGGKRYRERVRRPVHRECQNVSREARSPLASVPLDEAGLSVGRGRT